MAPVRPIAREVVFGAGIAGYKMPHLPTAPSGWTRAVSVMLLLRRVGVSAASGVMVRNAQVLVMGVGPSRFRKQERCRKSGHGHSQLHRITPNHYAVRRSICKRKPAKHRNGGSSRMGDASKDRGTRPYLSAILRHAPRPNAWLLSAGRMCDAILLPFFTVLECLVVGERVARSSNRRFVRRAFHG